ncbi:MAG: hypothetical protein LKG27_07365 [Clostridiaceae bacterium]|jgi:hypothetical protein|nr:hypothetical protein [Clostridiaceae bacterium]
MSQDQRALTAIQQTIGTQAMDASALGGTTIPNHNFLDITRVGKNAESQNTQRYNPQELAAKFNVQYGDRAGLFGNFQLPKTATNQWIS